MKSVTLDAQNLLCPMPLIKLQNLVPTLERGDEVKISATDPGVMQDVPIWCEMYGHSVLDLQTESPHYYITIKIS